MGFINSANKKQGKSKSSWEKKKELTLQLRNYFMQKKKINVELIVIKNL